MTTKSLHFKWTVSRGRDTYGYNICTLYVDGDKVAKCVGGGYDMQGTCLGDWLQNSYRFQILEKLEPLATIVGARHYGVTSFFKIEGFYGAELRTDGKTCKSISLDGGYGFDSMRRIAEAIGIELKWNKESDRYRNHSFYTAIIQ